MMPVRIGIAGKLAAGIFLLAFLSLLTIGVLVFKDEKASILEAREENLVLLVELMKQRIEDYTSHALESVTMLSRIPRIKALAREMQNGKISVAKRHEIQSTLMSFVHPDGDVEAFFLLHPQTGEVLTSSRTYDEGKFFDKRPYFITGRDGPVVYRVHYSPEMEKSILAIAVPVQDGRELLGVFVGWVNVDNMRSSISLNSGIKAFLVNRANLFVLDSTPPGGGLSIQSGIFTEAAERALDGKTGSGVYANVDGLEVVGAYTFIEPLDLALIAEVPLDEVMGNVDGMGRKVLVLIVVSTVVLFVAAMFLGRRVSNPLYAISRRAEELASKGTLDHPIEVFSGDELGVLGRSMNRLAENLALKESEVQQLLGTMDTLIEHIPEGVVLLDGHNNIVLANPMAQEYLRDIESVEVGQPLNSIQHRPLEELVVSALDMVWHEIRIDGNNPRVFELAARHIAGARGKGQIQGKVLVMKDITASREIEIRVQSQERLAAVGHLASGIAHDFNNILTCVIGYSEMMLADDTLPQSARTSVEFIHKSGLSAADLISQLLDFTRSSASELRHLDLHLLVEEFMRFIERILPGNIVLEFDPGPGQYFVSADQSKMLQVFTNLAVNARDAMPLGGTLSFHLSRVSIQPGSVLPVHAMSPGRYVLFRVADTGEGIPLEALPHIFEPFYTTKPKGKGTGLGLAQVYGIVKQHDGFIDVKSTQRFGTEFLIYLPSVDYREAEEEDEIYSMDVTEEPEPGDGQTILVVEDDPITRKLLEKELDYIGYRLLAAQDGAEGMRLFEQHVDEVDIVITDMVMPGMDGIEMSRKLQKIRPGTKIIGITGYLVKDSARDREGSGIVDWLQKPFRMNELATVVERVLATKKPDDKAKER